MKMLLIELLDFELRLLVHFPLCLPHWSLEANRELFGLHDVFHRQPNSVETPGLGEIR